MIRAPRARTKTIDMTLRATHQKLKELLHVLGNVSIEKLVDLPGIGEATGNKLLAKRAEAAEQGRAFRITDVMEVDGIGTAKMARITEEAKTKDVIKFATHYIKLFGDKYPSTLLSVDIGTVNSAYALLDNNFTLHKWTKVDLGLPKPYSPSICCDNVQEALKGFPSADMLVLEVQAPRTPTAAALGFLGISIELRILEAFMHALARSILATPVQSVSARMVAQYFGIHAKNRAAKKKAAVELVSHLLSEVEHLQTPMGNKIQVSDDLRTYFLKEKKKDDLSDCLLQAIAVFEWGQLAQDL